MAETVEHTAPAPGKQSSTFVTGILRVIISFIVPVITFLALRWSFTYMRDADANKFLVAVVALIVGVGAVWALYIITDNLVSLLPEAVREGVRPFVFVGPALVILGVYLVFPVFRTAYLSFFDARSATFIGLENFSYIFTSPDMLTVLRNNIWWLIVVTSFVVGLGLVISVMVDRVRWEATAKSIIFLPMAISAVGASVILKFIYSFHAPSRPQIGLLNSVVVSLCRHPHPC